MPFSYFLNLLERDTGCIGEFGLAQSQQNAAATYPLPDMRIYGRRASAAVFRRFRHVKNPASSRDTFRVALVNRRVKTSTRGLCLQYRDGTLGPFLGRLRIKRSANSRQYRQPRRVNVSLLF